MAPRSPGKGPCSLLQRKGKNAWGPVLNCMWEKTRFWPQNWQLVVPLFLGGCSAYGIATPVEILCPQGCHAHGDAVPTVVLCPFGRCAYGITMPVGLLRSFGCHAHGEAMLTEGPCLQGCHACSGAVPIGMLCPRPAGAVQGLPVPAAGSGGSVGLSAGTAIWTCQTVSATPASTPKGLWLPPATTAGDGPVPTVALLPCILLQPCPTTITAPTGLLWWCSLVGVHCPGILQPRASPSSLIPPQVLPELEKATVAGWDNAQSAQDRPSAPQL